jgi:hypothetical protein
MDLGRWCPASALVLGKPAAARLQGTAAGTGLRWTMLLTTFKPSDLADKKKEVPTAKPRC